MDWLAAAEANPAGGAAIGEAVAASVVGGAVTLAIFWLGWAHRTGRIAWLGRAADGAARFTGLPRWAGLPALVTTVSLITAVFGMYWDISLHISKGRDAGPFANPAHFFILGGLFGIFVSGFLALVLPDEKPSRAAIRLGRDWWAPLGAFGLIGASAFSLLGFPLDDVWHRIFGQDVTLWGPTHLMLIGGASLAFIGQATLLGEAKPHETDVATPRNAAIAGVGAVFRRIRYPLLAGGFLIALSTFQAEFDFGVPQFRFLFGPVLIAFAAGGALVAARIFGGPGGPLLAVGVFVLIRGALAVIIGPILGEPTPYFPLYLVPALLVEGLAFVMQPRRNPYAFGAVAGLAIGTVGILAEYGWSQVFMPIPWPTETLAEVALLAPAMGLAAGVLGAFIANAWRSPIAPDTTPRLSVLPAALSVAAVVAIVGYGLATAPATGVSAQVELTGAATPAGAVPGRWAEAEVRVDPPTAVDGSTYFNVTSWQGGGFELTELEPVAGEPGTFRTAAPIPVDGTWKSIIRLHKGSSLVGVPVYMPEDAAIPAEEIPAAPAFQREFIADHEILQREQVGDVPGWAATVAYSVVGAIVLLIIVVLGWSLWRLNVLYTQPRPPAGAEPRGAAHPTAAGSEPA